MKFKVNDDDGNEYVVEELEEKDEEALSTESSLTPDEISALKSLASVADKLIALISTTDADEDKDEEKLVDEDITEEVPYDEMKDEEKEEKVITTDSLSSIGAVEKKLTKNQMSDSTQEEICNAWKEYYKKAQERGY